MGKIFKIIGNFEQDGKWAEPTPNFTGKIAVEKNGFFIGYCDEHHESNQPRINKVRYLYSQITDNEGQDGYSIRMLKLSNYSHQRPLLYHMRDSNNTEDCYWAALRIDLFLARYITLGKAIIEIEEEPYSEEEYRRIKKRYKDLNTEDLSTNRFAIKSFSKPQST